MSDDRFATAFGRAAVAYERGRPGYPAAAIDALVHHLASVGAPSSSTSGPAPAS